MLVGARKQIPVRHSNSHVLMRIAAGLILVFALASAVALYFEQEARIDRLQERRAGLDQQLYEVQSRNAELRELKSLVDTEAYVERVARDQLGMVRPNEIIFED